MQFQTVSCVFGTDIWHNNFNISNSAKDITANAHMEMLPLLGHKHTHTKRMMEGHFSPSCIVSYLPLIAR